MPRRAVSRGGGRLIGLVRRVLCQGPFWYRTGLESPIHLIIVLMVVLLFGAKRVPELAKGLGEGVRKFSKGVQREGDAALETRPPTRPRSVKTASSFLRWAYSPKCLERLSGNSECAPLRVSRDCRTDERAPFRTSRATEKRSIRPLRLVSRQSLEGKFCEIRMADGAGVHSAIRIFMQHHNM